VQLRKLGIIMLLLSITGMAPIINSLNNNSEPKLHNLSLPSSLTRIIEHRKMAVDPDKVQTKGQTEDLSNVK